jgi:hypothetical protein
MDLTADMLLRPAFRRRNGTGTRPDEAAIHAASDQPGSRQRDHSAKWYSARIRPRIYPSASAIAMVTVADLKASTTAALRAVMQCCLLR